MEEGPPSTLIVSVVVGVVDVAPIHRTRPHAKPSEGSVCRHLDHPQTLGGSLLNEHRLSNETPREEARSTVGKC